MRIKGHLNTVQSCCLQLPYQPGGQIDAVCVQSGYHPFCIAHQLGDVRSLGGLTTGEGHHRHPGFFQPINGLFPLLGCHFLRLTHILACSITEDALLVALPLAAFVCHGTDHQIHSMRSGHIITVGSEGQLFNLCVRVTASCNSKQNIQQVLEVLFDILFWDCGIDLMDTSNSPFHDPIFIFLRDGLAVKLIDFLHKV